MKAKLLASLPLLVALITFVPVIAQGPPSAPTNVRVYPGGGSSTPSPTVTITISPSNPVVTAGNTVQFTATVSGTTNTSVVWSATGGSISSTGLYTAGSTPGTFSVTARLNGGTASQSAAVTVTSPAPGGSISLINSGPITTSRNGQVIEGLRITSTNGTALTIRHTDVVVRNVEIRHAGGNGIVATNAGGLRLENVNIIHTGAPARGPNPDWRLENVAIRNSPDVVITRVRVRSGSSGFHLLESPRARLSFIECHDARGPFPRGQCVQFDASHNSILEDFSYTRVPGVSWEEDNISVYRSSNVTVRRGLVDGNNSPSGVGVMFEQDDGSSNGGLAEDIDALRMSNGAFSGYPARNVTFRRTRARDNICTSQDGRGTPMSNALVWAGEPSRSSGLRIEQSTYTALCNPGNTVWDRKVFSQIDIASQNFTPRAPIRLRFPWE